MPKDTSSQSTLKRRARAAVDRPLAAVHNESSSPVTQPPALVESEWRASDIPEGQKIPKTQALKKYHLNKENLAKLAHTVKRHVHLVVPGPSYARTSIKTGGGSMMVNAQLYSEREVERLAWTLHGGPAGFEKFLEKKRALHEKRHKSTKEFEVPDAYAHLSNIDSILLDLEKRMKEKAAGSDWLWDVCYKIVDGLYYWQETMLTRGDVVEALKTALRDLPNYPPRVPRPSVLSPAFQALDNVLAECPKGLESSDDWRVSSVVSYPEYDEVYYWSEAYFTKVIEALIGVIRAHGTGDEGWGAARWMVYDTVSKGDERGIRIYEDFQVPRHTRGRWVVFDDAFTWLQGRLPKAGPMSQVPSYYNGATPAIWNEHIALLPLDTPQAEV